MSIEKLKTACDQIAGRISAVKGRGEEATKQALVLPLIDALGYEIWNPNEVCPEYEADFAIKKAGQKEKVDIAIVVGGTPRIYIEVKSADASLDGHEGQLARYFNATQSVTLGILTNGVEWRFFTDTGNPNVMDSHYFHSSKVDSLDQGLDVLYRFSKSIFSPDAIRDYATELFYTAKIADFLRGELDLREREPSEYFIRWILKSESMYDGVVNSNVVDRFKSISKNSLTRVIRDIVRRSVSALDDQVVSPAVSVSVPINQNDQKSMDNNSTKNESSVVPDSVSSPKIVTTEDELKFYSIIKEQFERSILASSKIFDASQRKEVALEINYKDTTGYVGVHFNKPSWWIFRAVLESKTKWIGFNIDTELGKTLVPAGFNILSPSPYAEFRVEVKSIDDINSLNRLIFSAMQKTIKDRERSSSDNASQSIEVEE